MSKSWIWPLLIYTIHSLLFADWIIDDAGISFVYARNWVEGHGLVSQAGATPIEGYSNFSWVFLMALFMKLGIFHPYWIPKLLALIFCGGLFYLLEKGLRRNHQLNTSEILFALSLIAINTSFVAMTQCGLENALYAFLLVLLWDQMSMDENKSVIKLFLLGSLIGILGLTRPEGLIFGAMLFLPFIRDPKAIIKILGSMALGFMLVYGSYLMFRIHWFGDWLPAPFYVKGGELMTGLFSLSKWHNLFRSVSGPLGGFMFVFITGLSIYLIWIKLWTKKMTLLGLVFFLSCLVFVILPYDGLWWYRFATPFLVIVYPFLIVLLKKSYEQNSWGKYVKLPQWLKIGAVLFIGVSISMSAYTTYHFIQKPVVPFSEIAERYGKGFNQLADDMGWKEGSILLPDVGGTLYYSRLKVHDLAGLTDAGLNRLYRNYPERLNDYVFDTIQPDIIHVNGMWALETRFDLDKRFQRDYIGWKVRMDRMVLNANGDSLLSGTFVRRERLKQKKQN